MPPLDPSTEMDLLLQDGMWSPSQQKEVRARERGRLAWPRGGTGDWGGHAEQRDSVQ